MELELVNEIHGITNEIAGRLIEEERLDSSNYFYDYTCY